MGEVTEKTYINLITWGYTDDYFYLKPDADKPLVKLLAIRANEHVCVVAFLIIMKTFLNF